MMFHNMLTRALEMILYATLHKLIGLYCEARNGDSTLGIRTTIVLLSSLSKWPEFRNAKDDAVVRDPTMCQNF